MHNGSVAAHSVPTRASPRLQAEVQAWMDFYDSNKDGKVHVDEYFALPKSNQRYWDSVDVNSDECGPCALRLERVGCADICRV